MALPKRIDIVEVGPRDGLQNEPTQIPTERKIEFIRDLVRAGLRSIEVTSFVRPDAVPQLADAADVVRSLIPEQGVTYSALVPNEKGYMRAVDAGIHRIVVFTAASETFAQKNIGMSIAESMDVFARVVQEAGKQNVSARAYLSTSFVCPFEGEIDADKVRDAAMRLLDLGVDQVAVSDTTGVAAPTDVRRILEVVLRDTSPDRIALHFHDTYGTATANVCAGLELGITTYDASAGGLGGCPFSPGAAGNLATEDLVYLADRMGIETGVDLNKVVAAVRPIEKLLGRELPSRQARRLRACGNTSIAS